jgi:hypothetical protein
MRNLPLGNPNSTQFKYRGEYSLLGVFIEPNYNGRVAASETSTEIIKAEVT